MQEPYRKQNTVEEEEINDRESHYFTSEPISTPQKDTMYND
jgi:hypothetical protein